MAFLSVATLAASLTGCATSSGSLGGTSVTTPTGLTLGGHVHGGNQPVTNAAITLWAAGTTGTYGTGSTSIKTTTTDANGNFSLDTGVLSPCTTGQYLYITAVGGNTGSGTNTKSAMMAALPTPCSATTGTQFVWINEITTVAAVNALQQFMSITPGGNPAWKIGAPASNVTGLANAFAMTGNLASIGSGSTGVVTLNNLIAGTTYTTTVTPDSAKISTLANILAYCVNSTGSICSGLFTDTTPTGGTTPTDTIQVAYDIATNAGGLNLPTYGNVYGEPYYLCTTYVSAQPPFPNGLTCSTTSFPTDWMIGVQLKAVNQTSGATVGTLQAGSVAIDASGNVWTALDSSSTTGGSVVEMNNLGEVIMAPVTTVTVSATQGAFPAGWTGPTIYTLGGARTNDIAIDTNGNAWYADYYGVASTDTTNPYGSLGLGLETPIAEITPQGVATGILVGTSPQAIAIDGSNNVFLQNSPQNYTGTTNARDYISMLQAAGTPAYSNYYPGAARGTTIFNYNVMDQTGNDIPFLNSCSATNYNQYQINSADEIALGNATLPTTNIDGVVVLAESVPDCAALGAVDSLNNLWATGGNYIEYINIAGGTVTGGPAPAAITNTPVITQIAGGTGLTLGGLDSPKGVAVDGLGHLWVANAPTSTSGGISEFTPVTTGTPSLTPLSPAGSASTIPVYGFGSAYAYSGAVQPVIDSSGNVWLATSGGSYLNLLVGGAAPVVTPLASQAAKGSIGVRP